VLIKNIARAERPGHQFLHPEVASELGEVDILVIVGGDGPWIVHRAGTRSIDRYIAPEFRCVMEKHGPVIPLERHVRDQEQLYDPVEAGFGQINRFLAVFARRNPIKAGGRFRILVDLIDPPGCGHFGGVVTEKVMAQLRQRSSGRRALPQFGEGEGDLLTGPAVVIEPGLGDRIDAHTVQKLIPDKEPVGAVDHEEIELAVNSQTARTLQGKAVEAAPGQERSGLAESMDPARSLIGEKQGSVHAHGQVGWSFKADTQVSAVPNRVELDIAGIVGTKGSAGAPGARQGHLALFAPPDEGQEGGKVVITSLH